MRYNNLDLNLGVWCFSGKSTAQSGVLTSNLRVLLFSLFVCGFAQLSSASDATEERVASALRSRPAIKRLVFSCTDPQHNPAIQGYFELRWQTNGIFVRQAKSEETLASDVEAGNELRGFCDGNSWYFDSSGGRLQLFSSDIDLAHPKTDSNGYQNYLRIIRIISPVLSFGVLNCPVQGAKVDGQQFSLIDLDGRRVEGRIGLASQNEIRVDYSVGNGANNYHWSSFCRFSNVLDHFPNLIRLYAIESNGEQTLYREYNILNYEVAEHPLPAELFLPDPLSASNTARYFEVNGRLYTTNHLGERREVRVSSGSSETIVSEERRYIVLAALVMFGCAAPIILWRCGAKRK